MWDILAVVAIILLIIYLPRWRNAVWGGATLGIILSLIIAIISTVSGRGFYWSVIVKGVVLGTALGLMAELLGLFSDFLKRK